MIDKEKFESVVNEAKAKAASKLLRRFGAYTTPPDEDIDPVKLPEIGTYDGKLAPPPTPSHPETPIMPRANRPQTRYEELEEAREMFARQQRPRWKSGLLGALSGALQGLGTGQGLAGALGGAIAGGAQSAIDPRSLLLQEFEARIKPKIQQRWQAEDEQRALERQQAQDALDAQYKRAQIGALDRSNQPQPAKPPAPHWVRDASGGYIDLNNPQNPLSGKVKGYDPPEPTRPHWARDAQGRWIDLNNPQNPLSGKVKGYDRPRAPRATQPKERKFASMEDVEAYAKQAGISINQAATQFRNQGYTIEKTRY